MKQEGIKLTDAEKVILKNIDPKYKYIARDKVHKDLWVFEEKAIKYENFFWYHTGDSLYLAPFNHLFKFITWRNKEPYLISDLLKREEIRNDRGRNCENQEHRRESKRGDKRTR